MTTKKKSGVRYGRKTRASRLAVEPRAATEDRYAELIEAIERALKKPDDALPVDVPEGRDHVKFRNALSSLLRRRLPNLPVRLRTLEGKTQIAVIRQ